MEDDRREQAERCRTYRSQRVVINALPHAFVTVATSQGQGPPWVGLPTGKTGPDPRESQRTDGAQDPCCPRIRPVGAGGPGVQLHTSKFVDARLE